MGGHVYLHKKKQKMGMPTCLSSQKKATLPSLPYNRGFKSDCVCEALHACPLSTQGLRLDQILLTPSPDSTFYFRWQRLKPRFFTHRLLPLSHTHRVLAEHGWGNRTGKVQFERFVPSYWHCLARSRWGPAGRMCWVPAVTFQSHVSHPPTPR